MDSLKVGNEFWRVNHRTKLEEVYEIVRIGNKNSVCKRTDGLMSRIDNTHLLSNYCKLLSVREELK